jgi:hypothetical protein
MTPQANVNVRLLFSHFVLVLIIAATSTTNTAVAASHTTPPTGTGLAVSRHGHGCCGISLAAQYVTTAGQIGDDFMLPPNKLTRTHQQ